MCIDVAKRLAAFGVLATPAFVLLVGWWPLNIMAALLVATFIAWLLELRSDGHRWLALLTFVVGGTVVEFWWPGLLCCLGARSFIRRPSIKTAIAWLLATASLWLVNGNFAAMAALPLIWGSAAFMFPLNGGDGSSMPSTPPTCSFLPLRCTSPAHRAVRGHAHKLRRTS